jgi:hypothetical protein
MLAHLWGAILKQYLDGLLEVTPQADVHTFFCIPRKKCAWLLPTLPFACEVSTLHKNLSRQLRDFSRLWAHSMGRKSRLNHLLPPLTTSFLWISFTIWALNSSGEHILSSFGALHNISLCEMGAMGFACWLSGMSLYQHGWAGDLLGWVKGDYNRPQRCSLEF